MKNKNNSQQKPYKNAKSSNVNTTFHQPRQWPAHGKACSWSRKLNDIPRVSEINWCETSRSAWEAMQCTKCRRTWGPPDNMQTKEDKRIDTVTIKSLNSVRTAIITRLETRSKNKRCKMTYKIDKATIITQCDSTVYNFSFLTQQYTK